MLGRRTSARLVVAGYVGDRGGQEAIDGHQRHAHRVVLGQALIVASRDDAVDTMGDEQIEVVALTVRPAHGIAYKDPIAVVRKGVLDLGRQLAEEGQSHRRNDDADRMGRFTVKRPRDLVGPVVEFSDRLGNAVLRLLAEVTAIIEHA